MKHGNFFPLSIVAASLVLLTPQLSRAQSPNAANDTAMNSAADSPTAQQEAAQMVSGQVHLAKTLDARKVQPGQQFEAIVDGTIHLKDGTALPHGTVLIGNIATDDMHSNGAARLALRFTDAKLKDGKTLPIQATIAGVAGPPNDSDADNTPPAWTHTALVIDEQGAMGGVELHSRIAGANSGVFVSTGKDDVKLDAGSQLSLAIGARG
jgi:hypothetical protein